MNGDIRQIISRCNPSQNTDEMEELIISIFRRNVDVKVVLEIGVHRGGSFLVWKEVFKPDLIIGIDNYVPGSEDLWKTIKDEPSCVFLAPHDSQTIETFNEVKGVLGDKRIDFLFIDGDHRELSVLSDYVMYRPLVRDGGVIAFHDIKVMDRDDVGVWKLWQILTQQYGEDQTEAFYHPEGSGTGTGVLFL